MDKIVVVLHQLNKQLVPVWKAPSNMTADAVLVLQYLLADKVSGLLGNGLNPTEACGVLDITFAKYSFQLYSGNPDEEALEAARHAKTVRENYNADLFQDIEALTGFDLSGYFTDANRAESYATGTEKPLDDDLRGHLDNLLD